MTFWQDECRIDFLKRRFEIDWSRCRLDHWHKSYTVTHKCRLLCKSYHISYWQLRDNRRLALKEEKKTPVSTWDGFRRSLKCLSSPSVTGVCLCGGWIVLPCRDWIVSQVNTIECDIDFPPPQKRTRRFAWIHSGDDTMSCCDVIPKKKKKKK